MTKLLTVDEVAEILRRPVSSIRWMRQKGTGPKSAVLSGRIYFREEDVDAWIDAQFAKETA